jgi:hypothetical protein
MLLTTARLITAALLIASAAAFAIGTSIERHSPNSESQTAQQNQRRSSDADRPGDNSARPEGAASGEGPATPAAEHSSETLLGVNPEGTGLVVIAVAVSLMLAALILTVRSPLLAVVVALVMLAFTALDVREVTHQLNESHSGLAALAATVSVLHLLAGAAALLTTRGTRSQPRASNA